MISKDKKRFTITFKKNNYDFLKEVANEMKLTISQILELMFVQVVLKCSSEEEKENEKESN